MRPIGPMSKIIIAGLVAGSTGLAGAVAASAHVTAAAPAACVKASVVAKPKLNTQAGSDETIQNQITSCAAKAEVVQVRQKLTIAGAFSGTFTLFPGQTVEITQHIPYRCCGTFHATDRVNSASGQLLATARGSWTFA